MEWFSISTCLGASWFKLWLAEKYKKMEMYVLLSSLDNKHEESPSCGMRLWIFFLIRFHNAILLKQTENLQKNILSCYSLSNMNDVFVPPPGNIFHNAFFLFMFPLLLVHFSLQIRLKNWWKIIHLFGATNQLLTRILKHLWDIIWYDSTEEETIRDSRIEPLNKVWNDATSPASCFSGIDNLEKGLAGEGTVFSKKKNSKNEIYGKLVKGLQSQKSIPEIST